MNDNNMNSKSVQRRIALQREGRLDAIRKRRAAFDQATEMLQRPFKFLPAAAHSTFDTVVDASDDELCCVTHWGETAPTAEFLAAAPDDVDWLLAELEYYKEVSASLNAAADDLAKHLAEAEKERDRLRAELKASKENADHLRKSCEMLSESVLAAQAEVERLRSVLKTIAEGEYCNAWESAELSGDLECPGCLVNDALCGQKPTTDPMQDLVTTSEELGLYNNDEDIPFWVVNATTEQIEEHNRKVLVDNSLVKDDDTNEGGN